MVSANEGYIEVALIVSEMIETEPSAATEEPISGAVYTTTAGVHSCPGCATTFVTLNLLRYHQRKIIIKITIKISTKPIIHKK